MREHEIGPVVVRLWETGSDSERRFWSFMIFSTEDRHLLAQGHDECPLAMSPEGLQAAVETLLWLTTEDEVDDLDDPTWATHCRQCHEAIVDEARWNEMEEDIAACATEFAMAEAQSEPGQSFWERYDTGDWREKVRMSLEPEVAESIKAEEQEFAELFGRKLYPDEPIFFHHLALSTRESEIGDLSELFHEMGLPEEEIAAFVKLGRYVTPWNRKHLSADEIAEWEEAVANPDPVDEEDPDYKFTTEIVTEFRRVRVVIAHSFQQGGPLRHQRHPFAISAIQFALTRAVKSLEAIDVLASKGLGEDALTLVRSMLEGYAGLAFAVGDPLRADSLFRCRFGIRAGTHHFCTRPNGKTDWNKITEKSSGRISEGRVSFEQMARASFAPLDAEIFTSLYDFLSGHAHPEPRSIYCYVKGDRWDHAQHYLFVEAAALGFLVGVFMLDGYRESGLLSRRFQRDLEHYLSRTRQVALSILDRGFSSLVKPSLRSRVLAIPTLPQAATPQLS